MLNLENFAVVLARAVELFRSSPGAVAEQKGALRALVALTKLGGATVKVTDGSLSVESVVIPPTLPGIKSLTAQLDLHGVGEIRIARNAAPADMLGLLRGLAASLTGAQSNGGVEGGDSIRVLLAPIEAVKSEPRAASVTQAFEAAGLLEAERAAEAAAIVSAAVSGVSATPLQNAIAELALNYGGPGLLRRLSAVAELIGAEVEAGRIQEAVESCGELVRLERVLREEGRRVAAIVLNRILSRSFLEKTTETVADEQWSEHGETVLRRGGVEAVAALVDALTSVRVLDHRRRFLETLRGMPDALRASLHLLDHHDWRVARDVAELVGEARIAEAVPQLGRAIEHEREQLRKAAAVALAQIGTPDATEILRQGLKRGDADIRGLVASVASGRTSGALALPLVVAAEHDPDPEMQREYFRALGRIGTPHAIQALINAAQPGGRFFRRRRPETRLAAIEGLRIASGAAATGTLEALRHDANRAVRRAAREALEDM
ncbi:MAG TPA: HEAT repeat domain-containing protein [Gemmatimonadales bacterium]